jgi:putative transposase
MKSFTYPQFGFKLEGKLRLSKMGTIAIKKHRKIQGPIKTLTIKKSPSQKWYAIFISEVEKTKHKKSKKPVVGLDLGIETFAYLSNGKTIENLRSLKQFEKSLARRQKMLFAKKKESMNRKKAKLRVAITYEKLTNRRTNFLHNASRMLVNNYSLVAIEHLKVSNLSRGFLAKQILDCSWAEFIRMLHYKAEEAGSEVVLVNPAYTTQECSNCGLIQKKKLAERWHECSCGASMHRDLNAARNILNRATGGTPGSQACPRGCLYPQGQVSSVKQEVPISNATVHS